MKWTSGALGSAIDVRGGDLLSVLLVPTGRGASSEAPVVGRPPCWKYSPKRAVGKVRDRPFLARGEGADELYYEHDLSPFWVPYPGTVWLQGGIGVEYDVQLYRTECYPPPPQPGFVLTLRGLGPTVSPADRVFLPYGIEWFEVPQDITLTITAAGEAVTVDATAGQRIPASNWGACRAYVESAVALPLIACGGRL